MMGKIFDWKPFLGVPLPLMVRDARGHVNGQIPLKCVDPVDVIGDAPWNPSSQLDGGGGPCRGLPKPKPVRKQDFLKESRNAVLTLSFRSLQLRRSGS